MLRTSRTCRGLTSEDALYIQSVQIISFLVRAMPNFPRFAPPDPPEWSAYYASVRHRFESGSGPPIKRPDDPLQPFRDANESGPRKPISIRVDHDLLALTKELARQHGLPYQVVIRVWIEEGLRRAIRGGAAANEIQ